MGGERVFVNSPSPLSPQNFFYKINSHLPTAMTLMGSCPDNKFKCKDFQNTGQDLRFHWSVNLVVMIFS